MSKIEEIIESTKEPITKKFLIEELNKIGIVKGDNVLVHSKLSSLGFVIGGERTVVEALMETVGDDGTIVMPTHSGDLCDPIFWTNPPVKKEWFPIIREEMPAFDKVKSGTFGMGKIVEFFRLSEGVERSYHPIVSFAAFGKHKYDITKEHSLDYSLGENSPLKKMYDLNFKVLLLGVEYDSNTMFHLAEYRSLNNEETINIAPIIEDGKKVFKKFKDIEFRTELFMFAGEIFEEKNTVKNAKIGNANIKLFNSKDAVDSAVEYFKNVDF